MSSVYDNPGPHELPTARCRLCREWFDCFPRRQGEKAEIRGCFKDCRRVDLAACHEHFERLRKHSGLHDSPYRDMETILLEQFDDAMQQYSNLLEFSMSLYDNNASLYRFSYSYPQLTTSTQPGVLEKLSACLDALDPNTKTFSPQLLKPARPPLVEQLLWGIDADPQRWRLKLYFQFPQGLQELKSLFLKHFFPNRLPLSPQTSLKRLHLLGLDFSGTGIRGIKLYYLYDFLDAPTLRTEFAEHPLIGKWLDGPRNKGLHDFIYIQRIDHPDSSDIHKCSEVDFSLWKNGLTVENLQRDLPTDAARKLDENLRIFDGRHVVVNRLSVPVDGLEKLNLYYYLLDPPA